MDGLLNKAEFLIENSPNILRNGVDNHIFENTLSSKLFEIYQQETSKEPVFKHITFTHNLLEKLVKRDKLNCLIVNLYKGNEGYSLAIKIANGTETETVRLKYEDDCFLKYIDNEELPPMLLDLLDESKIDIYNSGCIIVELRDFRRCIDIIKFESKYILLKPSNQSIAADVASLSRGKNWSCQEKLLLESEIVKRTAPSLNLSPSILVGLVNNKLHQQRSKYSSFPIKRASKHFTQVSQNRIKEFMECKPPQSLRLLHFLRSQKEKPTVPKHTPKPMVSSASKETDTKDCFDLRKHQEEMQAFYKSVVEDVHRCAKPIEKPEEKTDNSLVFVEEYILETERAQGRIYLTKLTISQRRSDDIFFGELYVDRDYQEGKQNGSTCRFPLGTQDQVNRYILQFKEILTEEGRKTVKIIHRDNNMKICQFAGQKSQAALSASVLKDRLELEKQLMEQTTIDNSEENTFKSLHNIIGIPVTTAVTTNLSGPVQQSIVEQPLVVGGNYNLTNILTSRSVIAGDSSVSTNYISPVNRSVIGGDSNVATNYISPVNKVTLNVQPGSSANNVALPLLAAQLNRPVPSYAQSIKAQAATASIDGTLKVQVKDSISTSMSNNSNLQALLAGTPSADNPNPHSKGATLLERLSAQSIGLNSMKTVKQNPLGEAKIISTSPCSILRTDSTASSQPNINFTNVTNLQGLNVTIPNLAGNLQTLQNVQIVTKTNGASVNYISSQSGLQQGQVLQFGQLSNSQLATRLSKPSNQTVSSGSSIPVLQVQGVGNSMFTSIQKPPTSQSPSSAQTVNVSLAPGAVSFYKNLKFIDS